MLALERLEHAALEAGPGRQGTGLPFLALISFMLLSLSLSLPLFFRQWSRFQLLEQHRQHLGSWSPHVHCRKQARLFLTQVGTDSRSVITKLKAGDFLSIAFWGNHRESQTVISFEVSIPQWCLAGRFSASPPVLMWLSLLSLLPAVSQADLGSQPSSPVPCSLFLHSPMCARGNYSLHPACPSWPLATCKGSNFPSLKETFIYVGRNEKNV